jgi:hypothetical protein
VPRSAPSTHTSTPAGSVTKNALASVRTRSTCSVSVALGAMLIVRVSVWYPSRAISTAYSPARTSSGKKSDSARNSPLSDTRAPGGTVDTARPPTSAFLTEPKKSTTLGETFSRLMLYWGWNCTSERKLSAAFSCSPML